MGMRRFLFTVGLGAGAMYLLDPDLGGERRARMSGRLNSWVDNLADFVTWTGNARLDLQDRMQDIMSGLRGRTLENLSDEDLAERVRMAIANAVPTAETVMVTSNGGEIVLLGTVHPGDIEELLGCANSVPGVRTLENRLTILELADFPESEY